SAARGDVPPARRAARLAAVRAALPARTAGPALAHLAHRPDALVEVAVLLRLIHAEILAHLRRPPLAVLRTHRLSLRRAHLLHRLAKLAPLLRSLLRRQRFVAQLLAQL